MPFFSLQFGIIIFFTILVLPLALGAEGNGVLENPQTGIDQSGIGLVTGWVCEADQVTVEINGTPYLAGYGTSREDTRFMCTDADNGFSLPLNWNLLGDGLHTVRVKADGVEFGSATFSVTTLETEFLRGMRGEFTLANFPQAGEVTRILWQESLQNFVLIPQSQQETSEEFFGSEAKDFGFGVLENPRSGSFQSGIGFIIGWICDAEQVVIEIDGTPYVAAYGTNREDTRQTCGDAENGFSLPMNWNLLGDGTHTVRVLENGVAEFGRAIFTVTTLGEEFLTGVSNESLLENFPEEGNSEKRGSVRVKWQESLQNFIIAERLGFLLSSSSIEFGEVPVGRSQVESLAITNTGSTLLTGVTEVSFSPFLSLTSKFFTIDPKDSHSASLRFRPTLENVEFLSDMVIASNAGEARISLSGMSTPAADLAFDPLFLDFGEVELGKFRDLNFTITNVSNTRQGGRMCVLESINVLPAYDIMADERFNLEPGESQVATVRFEPLKEGDIVREVGIFFDPSNPCAPFDPSDQPEPDSVMVFSGQGINPAPAIQAAQLFSKGGPVEIEIQEGSADFLSEIFLCTSEPPLLIGTKNEIGEATNCENLPVGEKHLIETNIGTNREENKMINFEGFPIGEEIIVGIHVKPTNNTFFTGPGTRNPDGFFHARAREIQSGVTLGFEDIFGGGDQDFDDVIIEVKGGVEAREPSPLLSAFPTSLNFSDVLIGKSRDLTFSVINGGGGNLTGMVRTSPPYDIVSQASFNLGSGESHPVVVRFSPNDASSFSGTADVTSDGGDINILMMGSGVDTLPPQLDVLPSILNFGCVEVDSIREISLILTNEGGGMVEGEILPPAAPFHLAPTGLFNLREFERQSVVVQFRPTSEGSFSDEIAILSNAGNFVVTILGSAEENCSVIIP